LYSLLLLLLLVLVCRSYEPATCTSVARVIVSLTTSTRISTRGGGGGGRSNWVDSKQHQPFGTKLLRYLVFSLGVIEQQEQI
jgi:hypothetical protein